MIYYPVILIQIRAIRTQISTKFFHNTMMNRHECKHGYVLHMHEHVYAYISRACFYGNVYVNVYAHMYKCIYIEREREGSQIQMLE